MMHYACGQLSLETVSRSTAKAAWLFIRHGYLDGMEITAHDDVFIGIRDTG
jgi:hypothetical protein